MNDIDYMIAVLQAAKEGKAIQYWARRNRGTDENWGDAPKPIWNWATYDYRVKPAEPSRFWRNWYPALGKWSPACFDSREEAASIARHEGSQQIEFVEVVK